MNIEKSEAWTMLGAPQSDGIYIIADHASSFVPPDINLQLSADDLSKHIAIDIGVAEIAALLVEQKCAHAAILGGVSRLVADCNREEGAKGLTPLYSDGIFIAGNDLSDAGREERLARFYRPYHAKIAAIIAAYRPKMILSLHSFTPQLASVPEEERPWDVGILYNEDARLAGGAIAALEAEGALVGDQQPYSGKILNATMNRHAEANNIGYIGIELRQDLVSDARGHQIWADRLGRMMEALSARLATA